MTFNLVFIHTCLIYFCTAYCHALVTLFLISISPLSLSITLRKKTNKQKKPHKCRQWIHNCPFIYIQNLITPIYCWLIIMGFFTLIWWMTFAIVYVLKRISNLKNSLFACLVNEFTKIIWREVGVCQLFETIS